MDSDKKIVIENNSDSAYILPFLLVMVMFWFWWIGGCQMVEKKVTLEIEKDKQVSERLRHAED